MREKSRKNSVWAGIVVLGFVGLLVVGCNKYDKISILGTYNIDLKEAQNLGSAVDSAKEKLVFNTGGTYSQHVVKRTAKWDRWDVKGKIERKNNQITFYDRVQDENTPLPEVTYKYRLEDDKLILIVEGEGFSNNEKVYTKEKKQ